MRAIRGQNGEYSLDLGEGQIAELHRSLFRFFVEVSYVRCEWSAQKTNQNDSDTGEEWIEHRIIRGSGSMPITGITIIQADGDLQSVLATLEVNIFAIDPESSAVGLGQFEFNKPIGSLLRHWEATPASIETKALQEHLYLAIALPKGVFETTWNELQTGGGDPAPNVSSFINRVCSGYGP